MIHRSRFPDVEIPTQPLTAYVFERAKEWLELPALIDGPTGRALTYGALLTLIDSVAAGPRTVPRSLPST